VDLPALVNGTAALVDEMRAERNTRLAAGYDRPILHGTASFASGPLLEVSPADGGHTTIEAAHPLIAIGSAP
jgi:mercuric reductase